MRRKRIVKFIFISFFIFILSSCTDPAGYLIRVRLESTAFDNPTISVNVEGIDGDAIESALVRVTDPGNRVYILNYLSEYGAYQKVLESRLSGLYILHVDSILDDTSRVMEFQHKIIATEPTINSITDTVGNNTLNGDSVNSSNIINIAWTDLGSDIVYAISINSGINTIYQTTSSTSSCIIPENTLPATANLTVSISAICQFGDPELRTENFYSVNSIDGSPYAFSTI